MLFERKPLFLQYTASSFHVRNVALACVISAKVGDGDENGILLIVTEIFCTRRLNQLITAPLAANCVDPLVATIPTSDLVACPVITSMPTLPVVVSGLCPVA